MRRRNLWIAIAFVLSAMTTQAQQADPAVTKLRGEALLEMSPSSIGVANWMATKVYNRGVEDIEGYTVMMKVLIQHTLNLADQYPRAAAEYKAQILPLTYNLATNTWIGWGAQGVSPDIEDAHQKLGLEAARLNVKVGAKIDAPPARRKNGYWVLGIHQIAAGKFHEAAQSFSTSRDLAGEAGLEDAMLMAQGWIHFANILAGVDESTQLAAIETKLRTIGGDGEFYASQYAVAMQVFRPV